MYLVRLVKSPKIVFPPLSLLSAQRESFLAYTPPCLTKNNKGCKYPRTRALYGLEKRWYLTSVHSWAHNHLPYFPQLNELMAWSPGKRMLARVEASRWTTSSV